MALVLENVESEDDESAGGWIKNSFRFGFVDADEGFGSRNMFGFLSGRFGAWGGAGAGFVGTEHRVRFLNFGFLDFGLRPGADAGV